MPDEPLIFVEVALVSGMAGNVHALLDEAAPIGDPERTLTMKRPLSLLAFF
jgi:malonyl-CoA decarboxylase